MVGSYKPYIELNKSLVISGEQESHWKDSKEKVFFYLEKATIMARRQDIYNPSLPN